MSTKLLKALKKRVGASWEVAEIADTLEDLQNEVGGYIETVTLAEDVVIICDEEGKLKDYPDNCEIGGIMFVGTILIVVMSLPAARRMWSRSSPVRMNTATRSNGYTLIFTHYAKV